MSTQCSVDTRSGRRVPPVRRGVNRPSAPRNPIRRACSEHEAPQPHRRRPQRETDLKRAGRVVAEAGTVRRADGPRPHTSSRRGPSRLHPPSRLAVPVGAVEQALGPHSLLGRPVGVLPADHPARIADQTRRRVAGVPQAAATRRVSLDDPDGRPDREGASREPKRSQGADV